MTDHRTSSVLNLAARFGCLTVMMVRFSAMPDSCQPPNRLESKSTMHATENRGNCEIVVPVRRELAIDFANTLAWRGSNPEESLRDLDALFAWLASANVISMRAAAPLRRWFAEHPQSRESIYEESIELREIIYAILHALALGDDPAPHDLA